MKRLFIILIILTVFSSRAVWAEDKAKTSATPSSNAGGGMTYSPTEGWVKTDAQHMQVGTDALVYQNQKQAIADAIKKNREKMAQEKLEADTKEKLWLEAKKKDLEIEADQKKTAAENETKKKAPSTVQKRKMPSNKSRVLVS